MSISPYNDEHRTVYAIRLLIHLTGCVMVWTGQAPHSFLSTSRRLLLASLVSVSTCWILHEYEASHPGTDLTIAVHLSYKLGEAGIASIVLLSCFLLASVVRREAYKLNIVFYVCMCLYLTTVFTNKYIKLGYLANSVVSFSSAYILHDFSKALSSRAEVNNVFALLYLEGMLFLLNCTVFILSFSYTMFGLKAAIYSLYIFRIMLVYILVRPHLEEPAEYAHEQRNVLKSSKVLGE